MVDGCAVGDLTKLAVDSDSHQSDENIYNHKSPGLGLA